MKINSEGILIDEYSANLERVCKEPECKKVYRIVEYYESNNSYFYRPYNYVKGCSDFCLECWLDVSEFVEKSPTAEPSYQLDLELPQDHSHWYNENHLQRIDMGDLELAYQDYVSDGCHVVLMPLSRFVTDKSLFLPNGVMIFPEGRVDLSQVVNSKLGNELAIIQTTASGVSLDEYETQPLIALPIKINWEGLINATHSQHMELIRAISETIDALCMNFICYKNCELTYLPDEGLPNSAGQLSSNSMMSSALFLRSGGNEAKLIAGAAFSHTITRGVGLVARQPEWIEFPVGGEVGNIVQRGMSLYSQLIKLESATSRFVHALSLLEFLAFPYEFEQYKKVKKIVSRYVSSDSMERARIHERFEFLTGKKDSLTKEEIGLRTRIVHIGARFEDLVPSNVERNEIFQELDFYIRNMMDHMIEHSHLSFEDYKVIRDKDV